MKKTLAILLVLAMMVAMLAGCGGKKEEAAAESYKIALITMDRVDQHWVTLDEGAMKAAAELGVEVVNMSPNAKDDAQQIEQINNAVSAGCDAIVVAANGPDSISSALKEAIAAGVKIIYVDSPANVEAEATFSTNNKAAGKTAGETMIAELEAKGITEGAVGIVNVNAATDSTVQREAGFREAFEGKAYTLRMERGEITRPFTCEGDSNGQHGLYVRFKPDCEIFRESIEFDYDYLLKRMREQAFLNAGVRITMRDERPDQFVEDENGQMVPRVDDLCYEGGIRSFVEHMNAAKGVDAIHPDYNATDERVRMKIAEAAKISEEAVKIEVGKAYKRRLAREKKKQEKKTKPPPKRKRKNKNLEQILIARFNLETLSWKLNAQTIRSFILNAQRKLERHN